MKNIITLLVVLINIQVHCQKLQVYQVKSNGEHPKLQWYETGKDIQHNEFSIWRASLTDKVFDSIQTLRYTENHKKDTILFTVVDTTLTKKAIYQYYISVKPKDAKVVNSPIVYGHNMGEIANPRLVKFDINSSKTQKAIELNWQLNHNFSVRSLSIFRSSHYEKDFVKIAEVASDATSYIDLVPLSNHNYLYFILIADYFGYQHPSPPTPGFCSYKQKPYPPQNVKMNQEDSVVKLTWTNIQDNLSGFKVYRSLGKEAFSPLHVMQTSNKQKEQFTDSIPSDLIESSYIRYFVENYSDSYETSQPSDTLSIFIEKKILIAPPKVFDALKQDNNQIKLIWSRPKNNGVIGYNVYRTHPTNKKLNTVLIPKHQNYLLDSTSYKSGQYMFEVESVGKDNQVSEFRMKTGTMVLSPYYHLVVDTKKTPTAFELIWKAYPTKQIESIRLYRQEEEQTPVLLKNYKNVDTTFIDSKLTKGKSYYYSLYAELVTGERVILNDKISVRF